jgi:pimeloyl-ACP methyl ester carboxylesterase
MQAEHGQVLTQVTSQDGTEIGYFTSGRGPQLLLVHGSLGDHSRWDNLRPFLESSFTVHAMDRRGRGASGDSAYYAIEREYEDVAAVIDGIANHAGEAVHVYCSSFGGLCAIGAAPLTSNIKSLALYEAWPSTVPGVLSESPEFIEQVEKLLEQGKREAALEHVYRASVGLSDQEIAEIKSQPAWPSPRF